MGRDAVRETEVRSSALSSSLAVGSGRGPPKLAPLPPPRTLRSPMHTPSQSISTGASTVNTSTEEKSTLRKTGIEEGEKDVIDGRNDGNTESDEPQHKRLSVEKKVLALPPLPTPKSVVENEGAAAEDGTTTYYEQRRREKEAAEVDDNEEDEEEEGEGEEEDEDERSSLDAVEDSNTRPLLKAGEGGVVVSSAGDEHLLETLESRLGVSPILDNAEPEDGEVSVLFGTFNMHGRSVPDDAPLELFLHKDLGFDIYCIGTEECETSIERAMFFPSKKKWEQLLVDHFGEDYICVATRTLQAIHIAVFVRKELYPYIHNVQTSIVPCGFRDVVGNKGACAVSFLLGNTSMVFINAHFAASQSKVALRNLNYYRILSELLLNPHGPPLLQPECVLKKEEDGSYVIEGKCCLDRFDHVFFGGDLNYRINGNRRLIDVVLQKEFREVLLANDQLNKEKAAGRVFRGFVEGPLRFPPTYKFDPGTDIYDTSSKCRIPAWTDRILFKKHEKVRLKMYSSCDGLKFSDHRPVVALFYLKPDLESEGERVQDVHEVQTKVCVIQ